MTRTARVVGAATIVLAPLLGGVADLVRMAAEGVAEPGAVSDWGLEEATAQLIAVEANRGAFKLASWLFYAVALLTIPATVALWRLAVVRSPRWAWVGAVLGALGVVGQTVHLTAYFGLLQVLAAQPDLRAAAQVSLAMDALPFTLALFMPYLLGFLATVPQAVALRRARVIPRWAVLAVCAGTALFAVVGSQPWSTVLYTGALLAGLTPAAAAMLWHEPEAASAPIPLGAVA